MVTVIIPSYNHAQYISQTILSVVNQDYGWENIQLIVIDDNSTDRSQAVINSLAHGYNFTAIFNSKNCGISANLNTALRHAEGQFVCVCGSDDWWTPEKLSHQVSYLQGYPEAAVHSAAAIRVDASGNPLPATQQRPAVNADYRFSDIFLRNFQIVTINAMFRASALGAVGGFDETTRIEDYSMWLRLTHAGYKLHVTDAVLGYYRIHSGNTIKKSVLMYRELRAILKQYQGHELFPLALRALNRVYFPQLAAANRLLALKTLPSAISNTRFFYRGLAHLLLPAALFNAFKTSYK